MKGSSVVDDFCVPNLMDGVSSRRRSRSCSCEPRYRRRARKYARARWRHIRRFVFRGMHLSPSAQGEKAAGIKRKKERKNERGVVRLSYAYAAVAVVVCVYACVLRVHLCCMRSHTHDRCDREGIRRDVRCVSANAGTITSDSGAATCVIMICHVCLCA